METNAPDLDTGFPERLRQATALAGFGDERGWQQRIADELGVKNQAIGQWMRGETLPCSAMMLKISQRFSVSLDWLMLNRGVCSIPVDTVTDYSTPTTDPDISGLDKLGIFIKSYGGSRLAKTLGVSKGLVSSWRNGRYPVPPVKCLEIQNLSMGAVKASELRPEIFDIAAFYSMTLPALDLNRLPDLLEQSRSIALGEWLAAAHVDDLRLLAHVCESIRLQADSERITRDLTASRQAVSA